MNKLNFTIKKGGRAYPVKKIQITLLLLVLILGYSTVPSVKADLPPETYYQGIDAGVNGDDVGSTALPIGFDFTFFGNTYDEFYVSSNGYIAFDNNDLTDYTNDDIDHSRNPDNYIAPFWDDTIVYNGLGQYVYYKTIGSAPNRQLIVQFTNVGFWNDPTPLGTFFVILYEGSDNIQLQYRYLVGDNARTHGGSATVGLENANGSEGSKYSFNTESLASEQVILFTPNGSNYDISTAPYEGVLLGAGATQSPDIPTQTAPLNGSVVSDTPTFSWRASANADSYELRIDNDANMGSLTLNPTGITETSFTPSSPLPIDTYYWIVIAHNADDSTWSEQWVFTTSDNPPPPLPGVPLLTSPAQDEADVSASPTFSWQAASEADSYQLLVSEQSDLSSPVIDQSGIISPTTSFDASGLDADTLYYWAVVASNVTGSTQSSTRSFTTLSINTPPTANSDSDTVVEDSGTTQIDVLANDTDPDSGDTLSIASVGATDNGGTAVINNNQIDYTPATNFFGTETFTYTISDGNGGADSASVTITVNGSNDAPTANDDSDTVVEDSGATQIDVLANDTDPDSSDILSISSVGATDSGGTAVENSGQIDYTPSANFVGTEVFTYTVSDGNGGTDTATVTITVTENPTNDEPIANDDSDTVVEDSGTTQIDVLANDVDPDSGDTLSINAVGSTDNGGTAVINNNQIDYTPALNFVGTETFTYTVSDGNGGSDSATATITVTGTNDAPTANDDTDTVAEDSSTTSINVLINDLDPDAGDVLSIANVGATDNGGTAVINSNQIDYTPAPDFAGTEVFTYTVGDGNGGSDTATVTITVTGSNDIPTANNDSDTIVEDSGTTQMDVLANDSDADTGDILSISFIGTPDNGGAAVESSGQIDYTPALNFVGTEVFTYTISDGNGGSDTATVTLTVTESPINDAPTANDDTDNVFEDSSTAQIDVLANDTDPDSGDVLSISSVSIPDNSGTAVINNNQIDYTPALNFVGSETFTYTISDGNGGENTATVTINVGGTNDAPIAQNDTPETLEDKVVLINVLGNDIDPDGDSLTISHVGNAANGTAVIQGNSIKYTPQANFHGTDTFSYTISDGEFSDVATVTITVVSVNDLPEANFDTATGQVGSNIIIQVLENDTDPVEGSTLTVVSVANPAHGTATTNGTVITYTPNSGFTGTEEFNYTISDGTSTATGTVTVTVNPYQLFIPLVIK